METRFGVKGTDCDGVFFCEGPIPQSHVRKRIRVEISRQNANLGEVKRRMARQAKDAGANAIMNFRYGQKAHSWFEAAFAFKWDSESWHGEGDAVLAK